MKQMIKKNKIMLTKIDVYLIVAIVILIVVLAMAFMGKSKKGIVVKNDFEQEEKEPYTEKPVQEQLKQLAVGSTVQETKKAENTTTNRIIDDEFRKNLPAYLSRQNERLRAEAIANQHKPEKSPLVLTPEQVDELEKSGNIIQ